jgi:hypothetical protein
MRIYFENLSLTLKKLNKLTNYTKKESNYTILYSENGIFQIQNYTIYRCYEENYHDTKKEKYMDHPILLDNTVYNKENVFSQLPIKYMDMNMVCKEYYVHPKSPVKLIVEHCIDNEHFPIQFYFLTEGNLNDLFVKKEIDDFLLCFY